LAFVDDLGLVGERASGARVDAVGGGVRDRGGAQQVGSLVDVDRRAPPERINRGRQLMVKDELT